VAPDPQRVAGVEVAQRERRHAPFDDFRTGHSRQTPRHEVVADQIDAPKQLVWFWNSWGTSFGVGGRFARSFDTWKQLLERTGDVTVPLS